MACAGDGLEVPVHAGSGGLACAAGHARAAKGLAAGHQLAFGEEPVSHARQERLWMAVLAVVSACGVARYDDLRLCAAARSANAFGTGLSLACTRERPPQARDRSVAPPGFRPGFAMRSEEHTSE